MGYWIPLVLGACLGLYVLVFIVRSVVRFIESRFGQSLNKRHATYLAVAIATVIAFVVSGVGAADGGPPDYSESWVYLLAGAIVFVYERWRFTRRDEEVTDTEEAIR